LRYLKAPVSWPQSDKAHAELRLLYQSVYQSPRSHSVARNINTTPRYLNFFNCCSVLLLTCSIHCLGFLERLNTPVFLVLIFIPGPSHAAKNCWSVYGRPCWKDASSTKSSAKIKRLILQLPTATRSAITVYSMHVECEKEWWQHTPLSESNTNGELSWFNSPDTDTIFWAGIRWLKPIAWKALWTSRHFTRNLVACFLEEVDKTCVDVFATLPRFHKNMLASESATTGTKTALGIIQFWLSYFVASFSRHLAT